jgi:hypothetical protein
MMDADSELVGWVIWGKKGIEYATNFPLPYVTNVSDFQGRSRIEWTRAPMGHVYSQEK